MGRVTDFCLSSATFPINKLIYHGQKLWRWGVVIVVFKVEWGVLRNHIKERNDNKQIKVNKGIKSQDIGLR